MKKLKVSNVQSNTITRLDYFTSIYLSYESNKRNIKGQIEVLKKS